MTLQNEKFEELIHQQLTGELEPQRGRAAAAFQAQIAAEAAERAAARRAARIAGGSKDPASWARRESRRALWLWAGVPSVIAAALAVAVTLHFASPNGRPITPVTPNNQDIAANVLDGRSPSRSIEGVPGGGSLAGAEQVLTPNGVVVVKDPRLLEVQQPNVRSAQWEPVDRAYPLTGNPAERLTPAGQP